jgi:hypothetical protein
VLVVEWALQLWWNWYKRENEIKNNEIISFPAASFEGDAASNKVLKQNKIRN